jgi:hypothetical protein
MELHLYVGPFQGQIGMNPNTFMLCAGPWVQLCEVMDRPWLVSRRSTLGHQTIRGVRRDSSEFP